MQKLFFIFVDLFIWNKYKWAEIKFTTSFSVWYMKMTISWSQEHVKKLKDIRFMLVDNIMFQGVSKFLQCLLIIFVSLFKTNYDYNIKTSLRRTVELIESKSYCRRYRFSVNSTSAQCQQMLTEIYMYYIWQRTIG